jgi:GPH family glycoside/pentoside/hexuronide:cation symporter
LGNGDEATGFKLTMGLLAVIATVLFMITFATTKERVKPQKPPEGTSLKKDIKFLFKNRPWIIMVIAGILTLSNVAVRAAVTNHFFKYYVGDDGSPVFWFLDRTSLLLSSGALAFITGILFTSALSKRFGKRNALMGLTLLNGFTFIGFYFIPADAYGLMLIVNIIGNIIAGPTPALVWAIYSDVADYGEWKFGRRTTGLVFSAAMFAQKMGLTIGGGVSGWLLSGFGFVANETQTETAMLGIRLMFSILPGALAIANGVILIWYPLSDEEVNSIEKELITRRAEEDTASPA